MQLKNVFYTNKQVIYRIKEPPSYLSNRRTAKLFTGSRNQQKRYSIEFFKHDITGSFKSFVESIQTCKLFFKLWCRKVHWLPKTLREKFKWVTRKYKIVCIFYEEELRPFGFYWTWIVEGTQRLTDMKQTTNLKDSSVKWKHHFDNTGDSINRWADKLSITWVISGGVVF